MDLLKFICVRIYYFSKLTMVKDADPTFKDIFTQIVYIDNAGMMIT